MKRTMLSTICLLISMVFYGQMEEQTNEEMYTTEVCVMHRVDEESMRCFDAGATNTFEYLKSDVIGYSRQYQVKFPSDHMIARVSVTIYKDGEEIESRSHAYSKSDAPSQFLFSNNAHMGPYMKPKGEDKAVIRMLVFQKTGDGYMKLSSDQTTFTILFNQEEAVFAEN